MPKYLQPQHEYDPTMVAFEKLNTCPTCGAQPSINYDTFNDSYKYMCCGHVAESIQAWNSHVTSNTTYVVEIMNLKFTQPKHPFDFYIDRRRPIGNPFPLPEEAKRDFVCQAYEDYFKKMVSLKDQAFMPELDMIRRALLEHKRVRLFCHCAPRRCHGETIRDWLMKSVSS